MNKKYFVGMTRFSLAAPNSKAWYLSQRDDYLQELFAPTRLEKRLDLFSKSLLQLSYSKSASPYEVYHFVFYSNVLPDVYKKELLSICSQYKFIYPIEIDINSGVTLYNAIETELLNLIDNNSLIGFYNLDDDDFLSKNYFRYSEKYISDRFINMRVSYGLGVTGMYDDGRFFNCKESYYPKVNIGILTIGSFSDGELIFPPGGSHMVLDKYSPIIIDSTRPMYFWTRHKNQDTNTSKNNEFGVDIFDFDAFPTISSDVIEELFPVINNNLLREIKIMEYVSLKETLIIPNQGTGLKVVFDITRVTKKSNTRPLFSFIFRDNTGKDIEFIDVKKVGVVRSLNEEIGYYRYIPASIKKNNEIILKLSENIQEVNLRLFSRGNELEVCNIRVYSINI